MMTRVLLVALVASTAVALADGNQGDVNIRPGRERGTAGPLPVRRSGQWGYVNHAGEPVIPPQFEEAGRKSGRGASKRRMGLHRYRRYHRDPLSVHFRGSFLRRVGECALARTGEGQ